MKCLLKLLVSLVCIVSMSMVLMAAPIGKCPQEPTENVVYLLDDEDISVFYICNWGIPVMNVCPAGLYFNPTLEVCDYIWKDYLCCSD